MFRIGSILSMNEANNNIKVRDIYNNAVCDINLDNHIHFQSMPVIGDIVLYINFDDKIYKVIKIWQIAIDPNKRANEFLLKSGELQLQGLYGQYIYLDNNGSIKFVDSSMLNEFELSLDGFIARLKKFQVDTYDGINVTLDKDILITRTAKKDDTDFSVMVNDAGVDIKNKNSEIIMTPDGVVTIKAAKAINVGNQLYGDCVTSGINGTLPFCLVTGAPIPGSVKVKVEK